MRVQVQNRCNRNDGPARIRFVTTGEIRPLLAQCRHVRARFPTLCRTSYRKMTLTPLPFRSGSLARRLCLAAIEQFPWRRASGLLSVVDAPDPGAGEPGLAPSASHRGVVMGFAWPSQSSKRSRRAGVPMAPSQPRTFRSAWQTLVDRSEHPPVETAQPHPATGNRNLQRDCRR